MVRRSNRHFKRGGGMWDSLTTGAADAWKKTKDSASSLGRSAQSSPPPPPLPPPQSSTMAAASVPSNDTTMGGRRRRRHRGGSCHANTSRTNLASTAAPYSGQSASPQIIVGGRTRKRRCNHKKSRRGRSCRHRSHRK